jgi:hypothetical protein
MLGSLVQHRHWGGQADTRVGLAGMMQKQGELEGHPLQRDRRKVREHGRLTAWDCRVLLS